MKEIYKTKHARKDGFSLVELIIVIAIMAILIGIIALAVLPNISRSRESKDIQSLDSIASAANSAVATLKAKGAGVIILGTTSTGVQDVSGFDLSTATEAEKIKHSVFDMVPSGAGITESDAIGNSAKIVLAYDVPNRKIRVAFVTDIFESNDTFQELSGVAIPCKYIGDEFFISSM